MSKNHIRVPGDWLPDVYCGYWDSDLYGGGWMRVIICLLILIGVVAFVSIFL